MEHVGARTDSEFSGNRPPIISRPVRKGLAILLRAYEYAHDLQCDPWDCAVEIQALLEEGLKYVDLRWMACKGYVDVAREVSIPGQDERQFRASGRLSITRRNCYVLTESGVSLACKIADRREWDEHASATDRRPNPQDVQDCCTDDSPHQARPVNGAVAPHWDRVRHELWFGSQMVKCFKLPSPNQETILTAFEEEGWPARIDDPLPPIPATDPKRRLQDTIKSLNRCQKRRAMRFSGDGTGEGILWEAVCR